MMESRGLPQSEEYPRLSSSKFVADQELADLLSRSTNYLGEQGLNKLIEAYERFNKPVMIVDENGRETLDKNWNIKQLLTEVPSYMEAASKVNLSPTQAEDLMLHVINSTKYDFERNEKNILLLTRGLNYSVKHEEKLTKQDLKKLKRMVTLGARQDEIDQTLYTYAIAREVGLSLEDSVMMIIDFLESDFMVAAGYAMPHFTEALKTLKFAKINPEVVRQTFQSFASVNRGERDESYDLFKKAIVFECPAKDITPRELMDYINVQTKSGNETIVDILRKFIAEKEQIASQSQKTEVIMPKKQKDRRFIEKEGRLEHAALAYRIQMPLMEGLKNLEQMAKARGLEWDEVAEGFWTFDPQTETWYSFGGETKIYAGKIRHEMIPYDISQLSDSPLLFHIHPEDNEIMFGNPGADFPSNEYRDHVVKFLSSTPSRADYALVAELSYRSSSKKVQPRSFIVHSLGITEFTYPDDNEKLQKMSREARDIRDSAMLNFDWKSLVGRGIDERQVVNMLVGDLNKILPEGFTIKFYPSGYSSLA